MKRLALTVALLAAFAAHAQDSTSSGVASSSSSSNPVVSNGTSTSSSGANVNGVASSSGTSSNNQGVTLNFGAGGAGTPSAQAFNADGTPRDGRDANGFAVQRNVVEGTTTQRLEGGTNSTVRNINEGVSTQNVNYSGTQTLKNVPSIQMSGPASGPCTGQSGGVGISGPGWGLGLNGSAVMDDCRLRENTRVLGMAMQSIDGGANPQERGEVTVLFMDAVRNLAAYNNTIYNRAAKEAK
jgi:hypothetical protein